MQDDQWPGNSIMTTVNVASSEIDDSFDSWNDLFSERFSSPHSSTGVNVSQVEASILDRVANPNPDAVGKASEDIKRGDVFGEKLGQKLMG
ncbi:hypothetical protein L6164_022201 [Bauhinia variegata]|uniref:Uncharacterized protein n=1 Tax=Bauhinia variegata TaxID=167791 RepID=A0ACB9MFF2_BAUVA|nr:hypothetical protein L6164_022201 [Bauhinia variegata]